MLINVIGSIAVGKSTFCEEFVIQHPEFIHVSIDQCRMSAGQDWVQSNKKNLINEDRLERLSVEENAWMKLFDLCTSNKYVVLESAGLSWRLKDVLHYQPLVERGIYTIKFIGDVNKCLERLKIREKNITRNTAFPYEFNMKDGVKWMCENIHRAPHNVIVDVDSGEDYGIIFKQVERLILQATLKYDVKGQGNNNLNREEEIQMQTRVTEVKFFNSKSKGKVQAFAAVTFNGEVTVRGYKIVQGQNGLFVGKPSQLNQKDQKWYDNVNYVSEELQTELHADILRRYQEEQSGSVGSAPEFNQEIETDDIPF